MINDLRFAFRLLLKNRTYTLVAIAALAFSVGANTAIFSAINSLLLRPLPVEDIDRLVYPIALREGFDPFGSSLIEYVAYRDRGHSFVSSGAAAQRSFNLTGHGEPERVRGEAQRLLPHAKSLESGECWFTHHSVIRASLTLRLADTHLTPNSTHDRSFRRAVGTPLQVTPSLERHITNRTPYHERVIS